MVGSEEMTSNRLRIFKVCSWIILGVSTAATQLFALKCLAPKTFVLIILSLSLLALLVYANLKLLQNIPSTSSGEDRFLFGAIYLHVVT